MLWAAGEETPQPKPSRDENISLSCLPQGPMTMESYQEQFSVRKSELLIQPLNLIITLRVQYFSHNHHVRLLLSTSLPIPPLWGPKAPAFQSSPGLLQRKGDGQK